jgi:hypothetical protein
VDELVGLLTLLAGLGALTTLGVLAACCLRLTSPTAFLLAAYVLAWAWVIAVTFALSPLRWLTRGSFLTSLLLGACLAVGVWVAAGRPAPPGLGHARRQARAAFADPAVLVLGVAVGLGTLYIGALALLTPSNDWDALSYHLARASLWHQEQGIGHIEQAADPRLNFHLPNAEIGQLATMLLAGNDRYTALPQLFSYAALVLAVAALARRVGLGTREAVFAALAFATLPVLLLQASGAMNDLVVASFLAAAAVFVLDRGWPSLALFAVALALAVGAKYTTIIALPALALVATVAQPVRRWPAVGLAGLAGCAAGSIWYVVNLVETGRPNPDISGQQADLGAATTTIATLRYLLSFVEMPGAPWPYSAAFLAVAAVLGVAGIVRLRRGLPLGLSLLGAALLTAAVTATPLIWDVGVRVPFRLALVLGGRDVVDRFGWVFNEKAEPPLVWYGPLGLFLLVVGTVAVVLAWRRGQLPGRALALAASPFVLLVTLALVLAWDLWRGRFLLFGVALAAATWGVVLRWRAVAFAVAAIGSTALFLTLTNYYGKSSGLYSEASIWGKPRWQAQTTRNGLNADVLRFVEERVPADSRLALSIVADHWIHPYFGPSLSRHVTLLPPRGGRPPEEASWLVTEPGTEVQRCAGAWRLEYVNGYGWRVERRVKPDACFAST